jgi:hypothetical protein
MAQKVETYLIDDLDRESVADETVHFALDGKTYEIDLTKYHAEALRENLADYIQVARKVQHQIKVAVNARRTGREELRAIRAWAKDNRYDISDRGRIPRHVVDAYRKAHH